MIVLDTNIISVLLTPHHPDAELVQTWCQTRSGQIFRITAITWAEIEYGIAILPMAPAPPRLGQNRPVCENISPMPTQRIIFFRGTPERPGQGGDRQPPGTRPGIIFERGSGFPGNIPV